MAHGIDRVRVALVFGAERMNIDAKDDVIAFTIAEGWNSIEREMWYRAWCRAVRCDVTRSDLRRVRDGRRRELNRALW